MEKTIVLRIKTGLHARPATKFVQLAQQFVAEIELEKNGRKADGKSIISLMVLGIKPGEAFTLRACGADQEAALKQLGLLLEQLADDD